MNLLNIIFILYSKLLNLVSNIYIPVFLRSYILFIVGKCFLKIKNLNDFNLKEYKNIKAFFIRKIKFENPIFDANNILAPCEGKIIKFGITNEINKLKVKQSYFDYNLLLNSDNKLTDKYNKGSFVIIYLAPHNYHRFHSPISGAISYLKKINGFSYPVNPIINKNLTLNERVILEIDNILLVFVGACGVREIKINKNINDAVVIGEELGFFGLGSTIILISKNNNFDANLLNKDIKVLDKLSINL